MRLHKKLCRLCGRNVGVHADGSFTKHKPHKGSANQMPCKTRT
jgi:hypothetical protein